MYVVYTLPYLDKEMKVSLQQVGCMAVCNDCGVWTPVLLSTVSLRRHQASGSGSMLCHGAIVLSEKSSVFSLLFHLNNFSGNFLQLILTSTQFTHAVSTQD